MALRLSQRVRGLSDDTGTHFISAHVRRSEHRDPVSLGQNLFQSVIDTVPQIGAEDEPLVPLVGEDDPGPEQKTVSVTSKGPPMTSLLHQMSLLVSQRSCCDYS